MPRQTETTRIWIVSLAIFTLVFFLILGMRQCSKNEQPSQTPPPGTSTPNALHIIDTHEHIQSAAQAPLLIAAMDALGIQKTILLGSSAFTLTQNPDLGFTGYDENNEELLKICQEYPGRFEAWVTLNPKDPNHLEKFKDYVKRGATGLKLYLGHGYVIPKTGQYLFHLMAMDDPALAPLYAYCRDNFIPVSMHVNPGPQTPGFADEFVSFLTQYPDLKVIAPHFILSSIKETRMEELLDTFPNLYTDISFGHDEFLRPGLRRIARDPEKYRALIAKYPNRFLFSADLTITNAEGRDKQWIQDRLSAYIDMLSKKTYTTSLLPDEPLNGLELSGEALNAVLFNNYTVLMATRPSKTQITRTINWDRMGVAHTTRKPGEMIPPPTAESDE